MTRSVAVGLLSLLPSAFLIQQIVYQLAPDHSAPVERTSTGRVKLTQYGIGRLSARRQCVLVMLFAFLVIVLNAPR